jgi:uncharacterized membrane protein SpoIIM required for sporulation
VTEAPLKSLRVRLEREARWRRLERLVDRLEAGGPSRLTPAELTEVPLLYRGALTSLSVARAISLDRNVLDYLETLCGRAWCCVHAPRQGAGRWLLGFLREGFPRAVRALGGELLLAAGVLLLGVLAGHLLTASDLGRFHAFVDEAYAQGRGPGSTVAELRDPLYGTGAAAELGTFSAHLFTHNATIGLLCFALGFALGLPVLFLLFTNGLVLGAFSALYASRGLATEFWAWILPHGVPELGAIALCGAAGLAVARGLFFPGPYPRLASLAVRGRLAACVALGAVVLLFVAGLVEGFFRQSVHDLTARYALAFLGAAALPAWILRSGTDDA